MFLLFYLNFIKNLVFNWPFFIFEDLAFFETAYGQIWPFYFFGPGNPAIYFNYLCAIRSSSQEEALPQADLNKGQRTNRIEREPIRMPRT